MQVDTLVFGMLVTRALRSLNIGEMKIGKHLIGTDDAVPVATGKLAAPWLTFPLARLC